MKLREVQRYATKAFNPAMPNRVPRNARLAVLVTASKSVDSSASSAPQPTGIARTLSLRNVEAYAVSTAAEPGQADLSTSSSTSLVVTASNVPEDMTRQLSNYHASTSSGAGRSYKFSAAHKERIGNLASCMNQCAAATVAVSVVSAAVMAIDLDGVEGTAIASMSGSTAAHHEAGQLLQRSTNAAVPGLSSEVAPALVSGPVEASGVSTAAETRSESTTVSVPPALDAASSTSTSQLPAVPQTLGGALAAEGAAEGAKDSVAEFFRRYTVSAVARPLDGLLLAALIIYAARPFSRAVAADPSEALTCVFQGVQRLSLVFEQVWVASVAVVAITLLDAATVWPDIVIVASAFFFSVAVLRSVALGWVLTAKASALNDIDGQLQAYKGEVVSPIGQLSGAGRPLLQRLTVGLTLGHMLQYERQSDHHTFLWSLTRYWAQEHPDEPLDCAMPQYELSAEEKQLLRVCMNSAEVAALALMCQGGASIMLSLSNYFVGEGSEAVSELISAGQKLLSASFVLGASHTFDAIIYTRGCDMGHLMSGMGKRGLTSLFVNLSLLSVTICVANALTLTLPIIEQSAVFTYAAERTSHEIAHAVLELQRVIVRFL